MVRDTLTGWSSAYLLDTLCRSVGRRGRGRCASDGDDDPTHELVERDGPVRSQVDRLGRVVPSANTASGGSVAGPKQVESIFDRSTWGSCRTVPTTASTASSRPCGFLVPALDGTRDRHGLAGQGDDEFGDQHVVLGVAEDDQSPCVSWLNRTGSCRRRPGRGDERGAQAPGGHPHGLRGAEEQYGPAGPRLRPSDAPVGARRGRPVVEPRGQVHQHQAPLSRGAPQARGRWQPQVDRDPPCRSIGRRGRVAH